MGRPKLHDEATERDLIRAAEGLLATDGVAGLSVRRLADAAGVSARAIYSRFGSKEGLLRALFAEAFGALCRDLEALPLTDDLIGDVVDAGARGFRRWALSHPDLFRLVFDSSGLGAAGPIEPAGQAALDLLLGRIRRCADAGLIPEGGVEPLGLAFHALCEGLASLEMRGRFPLPLAEDREAVWTTSLAGLVAGFRV